MNFANSKIYKLISNLTQDIYIGSTTKLLQTRLSYHKSTHNKAVSKYLFRPDAIVDIVLLENYACNNINELKAKELHYISTVPCINKNKPFISSFNCNSINEWRQDYRNQHLEQSIHYRNTHLEKMKQYQLIYQNRPENILIRKQYFKRYHMKYKIKQQMIHGFENLPFHLVY